MTTQPQPHPLLLVLTCHYTLHGWQRYWVVVPKFSSVMSSIYRTCLICPWNMSNSITMFSLRVRNSRGYLFNLLRGTNFLLPILFLLLCCLYLGGPLMTTELIMETSIGENDGPPMPSNCAPATPTTANQPPPIWPGNTRHYSVTLWSTGGWGTTVTRVGPVGCHAPPKKWYNFLIKILLLLTITQWQLKNNMAIHLVMSVEPIQCDEAPTTTTTTCEIMSQLNFRGAGLLCATTTATTCKIECLGLISRVGDSLLPPPPLPPMKLSISAWFQGWWSLFCCHCHHHPQNWAETLDFAGVSGKWEFTWMP